jgi:hypothetical protein
MRSAAEDKTPSSPSPPHTKKQKKRKTPLTSSYRHSPLLFLTVLVHVPYIWSLGRRGSKGLRYFVELCRLGSLKTGMSTMDTSRGQVYSLKVRSIYKYVLYYISIALRQLVFNCWVCS